MATAAAVKEGAELAKLGIELLGKVADAVKGFRAAKVKRDWEGKRLEGFKTHLRDLSTDLQTAAQARTRPTRADKAAKDQLTSLRDGIESIIKTLENFLGSRRPGPSKDVWTWTRIWIALKHQAFGSKTEMHLNEAEDLLTTLLQNFEQLKTLGLVDGRMPAGMKPPVERPRVYRQHEAFDTVCTLLAPPAVTCTDKQTQFQEMDSSSSENVSWV
jgi:hypothetical protein